MKYQIKNVLLLDDNEIDLFINEQILRISRVGASVSSFTDGHIALRAVREKAVAGSGLPDLLFVDLNMHQMPGFVFIKEYFAICEEFSLLPAPIAILTSSVSLQDHAEAARLTPDSLFINKPLTAESLFLVLSHHPKLISKF